MYSFILQLPRSERSILNQLAFATESEKYAERARNEQMV
jgi:hypothetical protein